MHCSGDCRLTLPEGDQNEERVNLVYVNGNGMKRGIVSTIRRVEYLRTGIFPSSFFLASFVRVKLNLG